MAPDSAETVLGTLVRMVAAVAVGVGAGLAVEGVLPAGPALVVGAISGGTAGAVTLGAAWALGVGEVQMVPGAIRRRLLTACGR